MIRRLLIANRGEIACRIIRTCRRLGIETVAVYSEADAGALHTKSADQAVLLGPAAAAESYLNIPKLLAAVASTGADAVHPGYGFLSENADFVAALERADCTFVGPDARTIALMGSKADAKATMEKAGVPVVPGYHGEEQSTETLREEAERVGYPLMLKAAAGGGGKGMRIVRSGGELPQALDSARREALGAFGDDRMILERYLETPRHLEVQIFGDGRGNVVHLFERDCSAQRRYQKVLEESPAPGLSDEQRLALCSAGVEAARAVDYRGAGTVEFIADSQGEFFFMEMNTRLQVEHPVTEAVTGIDLVEWQLRVAAGETLPLPQDQIRCQGHALEARIYAEDPDAGFLPASGTLSWLHFPSGARADAGFQEGDEVTVHYDPMLAKMITHGSSRREALTQMEQALTETRLAGPRTNLAFLARLIRLPAFVEGAMHTALLDSELPAGAPAEVLTQHLIAAAVTLDLDRWSGSAERNGTADCFSPWSALSGWRVGQAAWREYHLGDRDARHVVRLRGTPAAGYDARLDDEPEQQLSAVQRDANLLSWQTDGRRQRLVAEASGAQVHVAGSGFIHLFEHVEHQAGGELDTAADSRVLAPMPGKVVTIRVNEGDLVEPGQELMVMEAMKMELSLKAPAGGSVSAINCSTGSFVEADTLLLELELAEAEDETD
ncbi:MAG: biotin carboxylase N-terminal domain-containing protein [Pseudomonadota bacterium]